MFNFRLQPLCSVVFLLTAGSGWTARAAEPPKTSKELFEYIQEARKLGLNDERIKENAITAGWDRVIIEQTYSIVRLLNQEKVPDAARLRSPTVVPEGYRIGAGDVLQIVVWREPDASVPETMVRADGKISMPLIREVEAVGFTPAELERVLAVKLLKFLRDPEVTVVPRDIRSKKIYMVGAVKKEGPIPLLRPMTVLQALNEAGGVTDFAKKNKIYILRNENGRQAKLPFSYQSVIRGERLEQNIPVLPDDTIVVPQ